MIHIDGMAARAALRLPSSTDPVPAHAVLSGALDGRSIGGDSMHWALHHPRAFLLAQMFAGALAGFLLLLRIVNSPFGRVLQAIRENEFRAEAVGYRTVHFRTAASVLSALAATLAGVLYALWLRYSGPEVTLSFNIMVDILLMVVIGGMGTMYGAAIGATIFVLAQTYLQDLMRVASEAVSSVPVLPVLIHPDRWLLWLGVLFVLSVYFLPAGLVGKLRAGVAARLKPGR